MEKFALHTLLRRASVAGDFDPQAILTNAGFGQTDISLNQKLLGALSLHCTEVIRDTQYMWKLDADTRLDTFHQMVSKKNVEETLGFAPPVQPGDFFASTLQKILRGEKIKAVKRLPNETTGTYLNRQLEYLAATFDAAQFAAAIPALNSQTFIKLAQRTAGEINQLQRARDINIVLPSKFYGRKNEKVRLSRFLRGQTKDKRPVMVTGIGGAGKSALLASLLGSWYHRKNAPLCIVLDFDRPQLSSGEPREIMHEFLRQILAQIKLRKGMAETSRQEVMSKLSKMRAELPRALGPGNYRDYESQLSELMSVSFNHFELPWAKHLQKIPIALLLDSFEAIDRRGVQAVRQIMELEKNMRQAGLVSLRSIISGRAPPLNEEDLELYFGPENRRMKLKGLDDVAGGAFLESLDTGNVIPTEILQSASRALKGHPLAIMVLARYAQDHVDTIESLISNLDNNAGFAAEYAQVFLYERILDRISNDKIRLLAHPGLVLRQINAYTIEKILAIPCLEKNLDGEEARDLMAKLENEYWLVEQHPDGQSLRHRADLRREMLPGLFAKARDQDNETERERKIDLRQRTIAVCKAAANFYRTAPDPDAPLWWTAMSLEKRTVEAQYYSALAGEEPGEFSLEEANALFNLLGEDFETMPDAWTARARALRGEAVTTEERNTLEGELLESVAASAFAQSVRQTGGGTTEPEATGKDHQSPENYTLMQLSRSVTVEFSNAEFDHLFKTAKKFTRDITYAGEAEKRELETSIRTNFWESSVWQAMLLSGFEPSFFHMTDIGRDFFRAIKQQTGVAEGRKSDIFKFPILSHDIGVNRMAAKQKLYAVSDYPGSLKVKPMPVTLSTLCLMNSDVVDYLDNTDSKELRSTKLYQEIHSLTTYSNDREGPRQDFVNRLYDAAREFDSSTSGVNLFEVPNEYTASKLLRGLSPDLHLPIRSIMANPDIPLLDKIIPALADRAKYWPVDLIPSNMKSKDRLSNQDFAPIVVETADRCGILPDLFKIVTPYDSRADQLIEMYNFITTWFFEPDHMVS